MKIQQVSLNPLSYLSVPLRLIRSGEERSLENDASGFLYKYEKDYYLITNKHVFTGVNPLSSRVTGRAPDAIEIPLLESGNEVGIRWSRKIVPLYEQCKPTWLIHPKNTKVDVVALLLGENDGDYPLKAVNETSYDAQIPKIGDDVFVLGYPLQLRTDGNFPYWKRGSIASEPDIDNLGLPRILIDTSTKEGMSGAPVFYRQNSFDGIESLSSDHPLGSVFGFLGTYSGRYVFNDDRDGEENSQLGMVWKKDVIEEILKAKVHEQTCYHICPKV